MDNSPIEVEIRELVKDAKVRAVALFKENHDDGDTAIYQFITDVIPLFEKYIEDKQNKLLVDLDEIDNKPWRVFRQLAKVMPEYADTYERYEKFYSHGGGQEVMKLIEKFEETNND